MANWLENITNWVDGLDPWLQVLALFVIGMIPMVEAYGGVIIGIVLGISPFIAFPAAVLGNLAIVYALTLLAGRTRSAVMSKKEPVKRTEKQQSVAKWMDRLGVPGASLIASLIVPSMLVGPVLVGLGARKVTVMVWMTVAVLVWAFLTLLLGEGLLTLFS